MTSQNSLGIDYAAARPIPDQPIQELSQLERLSFRLTDGPQSSEDSGIVIEGNRMSETLEDIEKLDRNQLIVLTSILSRSEVEFLQALLAELQLLLARPKGEKPRPPIPLTTWREVSATQLLKSFDLEMLMLCLADASKSHGLMRKHAFREMVRRADSFIREGQAAGKSRTEIIGQLAPVEVLTHMHFSAEADCLQENPELTEAELKEGIRQKFKQYFGASS